MFSLERAPFASNRPARVLFDSGETKKNEPKTNEKTNKTKKKQATKNCFEICAEFFENKRVILRQSSGVRV